MKPIELPSRDYVNLDLAEEIKARVGMEEIAEHYCGVKPVMHRIPCPFHSGKDRNLALYRNGYKCYVCGAAGDQISFVRQLTGTDFVGAVRDIDRAFGLGLPLDGEGRADPVLLREAARRAERRRRERLEEQERDELRNLLWDVWALCDRVLRECGPEDPRWAAAARHIDWLAYLIDIYD